MMRVAITRPKGVAAASSASSSSSSANHLQQTLLNLLIDTATTNADSTPTTRVEDLFADIPAGASDDQLDRDAAHVLDTTLMGMAARVRAIGAIDDAELHAIHPTIATTSASVRHRGNNNGSSSSSVITVDPSVECAASSDIPFNVNYTALPNVLQALHITLDECAQDVEQLADDAIAAHAMDDDVMANVYQVWVTVVVDLLQSMRTAWLPPAVCEYASIREFSGLVERLVHSQNIMGYSLQRYCELLGEKCAQARAEPRYEFPIVHGRFADSHSRRPWIVLVYAMLPDIFVACFFEPREHHSSFSGGGGGGIDGMTAASLFHIRGCVFFPDALSNQAQHLLRIPHLGPHPVV